LGGDSDSGAKMRATLGWNLSPGIINTNSSGFTALPAGFRPNGALFTTIGDGTTFWSSSQDNNNGPTSAWVRYLYYSFSCTCKDAYDMSNGYSVRCVRN